MDIGLDEVQKNLEAYAGMVEQGVSKLDYLYVMVNALFKLHPELAKDPEVADFMKRLSAFQEKHS